MVPEMEQLASAIHVGISPGQLLLVAEIAMAILGALILSLGKERAKLESGVDLDRK